MRRVMARMMGGTRLPPIPYLLSNMVTKKAPRKPPDDERDIKRDDELSDLPPEVRREEVRPSCCSHPRGSLLATGPATCPTDHAHQWIPGIWYCVRRDLRWQWRREKLDESWNVTPACRCARSGSSSRSGRTS